ncbi:hypothetical protein RI367_008534 [Sorochytrium milnesiophthora]
MLSECVPYLPEVKSADQVAQWPVTPAMLKLQMMDGILLADIEGICGRPSGGTINCTTLAQLAHCLAEENPLLLLMQRELWNVSGKYHTALYAVQAEHCNTHAVQQLIEPVKRAGLAKDMAWLFSRFGSPSPAVPAWVYYQVDAELGDRVDLFVAAYDRLTAEDDTSGKHPRKLSFWSEAQAWWCQEQLGAITGVFKTQVKWILLSLVSPLTTFAARAIMEKKASARSGIAALLREGVDDSSALVRVSNELTVDFMRELRIIKDQSVRDLARAVATGDDIDASGICTLLGIDSAKTPRLIQEPQASVEAVTKDIVQALHDKRLEESIDYRFLCRDRLQQAFVRNMVAFAVVLASKPWTRMVSGDGKHQKMTAKEFAMLRGLDESKLSRLRKGCMVVAHMHLGGQARMDQQPRSERKAYNLHCLAKSLERSFGVVYHALGFNDAKVNRALSRLEEVLQTVKEWEQQHVPEHQWGPDEPADAGSSEDEVDDNWDEAAVWDEDWDSDIDYQDTAEARTRPRSPAGQPMHRIHRTYVRYLCHVARQQSGNRPVVICDRHGNRVHLTRPHASDFQSRVLAGVRSGRYTPFMHEEFMAGWIEKGAGQCDDQYTVEYLREETSLAKERRQATGGASRDTLKSNGPLPRELDHAESEDEQPLSSEEEAEFTEDDGNDEGDGQPPSKRQRMSSASASMAADQPAGITTPSRGNSDATATVEQSELSTLSGRTPASPELVETMPPAHSTLVPPAPVVSGNSVDASTGNATAAENGEPADRDATQEPVQASHPEAAAPPPEAAESQALVSLASTEQSATSSTTPRFDGLPSGLRDQIEPGLEEHEWYWSPARETWRMLLYVSSVERRQLVTIGPHKLTYYGRPDCVQDLSCDDNLCCADAKLLVERQLFPFLNVPNDRPTLVFVNAMWGQPHSKAAVTMAEVAVQRSLATVHLFFNIDVLLLLPRDTNTAWHSELVVAGAELFLPAWGLKRRPQTCPFNAPKGQVMLAYLSRRTGSDRRLLHFLGRRLFDYDKQAKPKSDSEATLLVEQAIKYSIRRCSHPWYERHLGRQMQCPWTHDADTGHLLPPASRRMLNYTRLRYQEVAPVRIPESEVPPLRDVANNPTWFEASEVPWAPPSPTHTVIVIDSDDDDDMDRVEYETLLGTPSPGNSRQASEPVRRETAGR